MSYLAYRLEGGAYEAAIEQLEFHITKRRQLAAKLRDLRKLTSGTELRHKVGLLEECATRSLGLDETPFKPTASAFRNQASQLLAYSRTKWTNPCDSEYYSADGYDDFQGEQRECAKYDAVVAFVIWKHLTGRQLLPVVDRV